MAAGEILSNLRKTIKDGIAAAQDKKIAQHYTQFVTQNELLRQAETRVYTEVNEFFAAVVTNGNGTRKAFLERLSSLPTPVLTQTLLVYLHRGEGSQRGEWFPGVIDEIGGILRKDGQPEKVSELFMGLYNNLSDRIYEFHLTEKAQHDIIGHLSGNVIYESLPQAHSRASVSNT